jgi:protein required for attachment to host cells
MPERKPSTWVAVADGGKALLLEAEGPDLAPKLRMIAAAELDNPPTREQGADRPGRYPDPGHGRSAVEATDWHDIAEERFLADFAARLNDAALAGRYDRLVLFAPARALGRIRASLGAAVRERLAAEVDRDLTNHPVPEIAERVREVLKPGF